MLEYPDAPAAPDGPRPIRQSEEDGSKPSPPPSLYCLLAAAMVSGEGHRHQEGELTALATRFPGRDVSAGGYVFRKGDVVKTVSVIRSGRVALINERARHRTILSALRPGDVVLETALLSGNPARRDAVALVDTTLLEIPAGMVLPIVEDDAGLALRWMTGTCGRLASAWGRLEELLAGGLCAQVASLLLHEFLHGPDVVLTQQVIADMLGARRSSVTRVLGDLQRQRLIALGYGRITLLDREGLGTVATQGVKKLGQTGVRALQRGAAA